MNIVDFHKAILQSSADSLKRLAAFNPLTIHKKGSAAKATFALALVCILWGTTWIASKEGVSYMPALQLAGIRQFLAGSIYVAFFLSRKASWPRRREWKTIVVLSVLNFLLSNGLSTWAVKYISAGLGAIMGAIFPLWIVIIGLFSAREKIPRKAIFGLLLGFAGVCVIFSDHLGDFVNRQFVAGILISLVATWTWAFATIYTKSQAGGFNPYFSLGLQMMISGSALLLGTRLTGTDVPLQTIPWQSWAAIAYLVIFGSLLAFICYLYALQRLPTERVSIYAYINPVVAVICGAIFFGEKTGIFIILGGIIALAGVFIVNKAFKSPPIEQPETEGI